MRSRFARKGLKILAVLIAGIALGGWVVMALWNAVLPAATGLHAITFLQALALLALARILFGGWRGRGGGRWRERMQARWAQMTPEQRQQLHAHLGGRRPCCAGGPGDDPVRTS